MAQIRRLSSAEHGARRRNRIEQPTVPHTGRSSGVRQIAPNVGRPIHLRFPSMNVKTDVAALAAQLVTSQNRDAAQEFLRGHDIPGNVEAAGLLQWADLAFLA